MVDHQLVAVMDKLKRITYKLLLGETNTLLWNKEARELITLCEEVAWQPIDSAPRDGTLLVWRTADKTQHAIIYWPCYKECFWEEGAMYRLLYPPTSIFTD